ncbi:MAG: MFS transporter [Spirochaetes bacterium]|nr:MFS transporter [Spirochaetota bacterium]
MKKYHSIFYYTATANFLFFLGNSMFILFPVFLKNLGASESYIGLMNNIDKVFLIITALSIGKVMRRTDHLKLLRAGYIILLIAYASYLLISDLGWFIVVIRIFHGIGFSVAMILGTTIIFDIVPIEDAAEAIGVYGITGAITNAISPFIGEMLLSRGYSHYLLFAISSLLIILSIGITFIVPRPEKHRHSMKLEFGGGLSLLLSGPKYILLAVITIIFGGGFGVIVTYLPNFVRTTTNYKYSYFFILYICVLIIIRFTFMKMVNSLNRVSLIMAVFTVGILMNASLNFLYSAGVLVLAGVLYGITHGVLYPLLNATMVGLVNQEDRDRANAQYTACFNFGMMIFAFSLGFLVDYCSSYLAAFNACAVSGLAAILMIYFITNRHGGLDAALQNEKMASFKEN